MKLSSMHSDITLLSHIHDELIYLLKESNGLRKEDFLVDDTLKRAFARSLEIIGEAVKGLGTDIIVKNSNIQWRSIAGMRDKLIHGYFSVDYSIVWDVVVNKVPDLKEKIGDLLKTLRP
jgi:uncharacterized protein with HEPN domain